MDNPLPIGPKSWHIGNVSAKAFEEALNRTSRGLALSRRGLYGPTECFRDWAQAYESMLSVWLNFANAQYESTQPFWIVAEQTDKNIQLVVPVALPDWIDIEETGAFHPEDKIKFTARLAYGRRVAIVTIPDVSAAAKGSDHAAELKDATKEKRALAVIRLKIAE